MKKVKTLKDELDVKRFYVGKIKVTCPNCKKKTVFLETYDYISYPILNKKETQHSFCENCEVGLDMEMKVKATIEYNPDKVKVV